MTVRPWKIAWWALVGALAGFGIAGIMTIGVVLLALGGVLALIGILRPELRNRSALGVVGGVAVAPLYIAWLNRAGPGQVCGTVGSNVTCTQEYAPWPFVAVALGLVVVCVFVIRRSTR